MTAFLFLAPHDFAELDQKLKYLGLTSAAVGILLFQNQFQVIETLTEIPECTAPSFCRSGQCMFADHFVVSHTYSSRSLNLMNRDS